MYINSTKKKSPFFVVSRPRRSWVGCWRVTKPLQPGWRRTWSFSHLSQPAAANESLMRPRDAAHVGFDDANGYALYSEFRIPEAISIQYTDILWYIRYTLIYCNISQSSQSDRHASCWHHLVFNKSGTFAKPKRKFGILNSCVTRFEFGGLTSCRRLAQVINVAIGLRIFLVAVAAVVFSKIGHTWEKEPHRPGLYSTLYELKKRVHAFQVVHEECSTWHWNWVIFTMLSKSIQDDSTMPQRSAE